MLRAKDISKKKQQQQKTETKPNRNTAPVEKH